MDLTKTRPDSVARLVNAIQDAMHEHVQDATVAEVTSAVFTVTSRLIEVMVSASSAEQIIKNKLELTRAVNLLHEQIHPKYVM